MTHRAQPSDSRSSSVPPGNIIATSSDHVIAWLFRRVYNDREVDAGILTICLGAWIGLFSDSLSLHAWWAEVFHVLPPWVWATLLLGAGGFRAILGVSHHHGRGLAAAAAVSSFLFAFMGLLTALIDYRMTVTPILFWLSYGALKSHLRLMFHLKLGIGK